jgi:hypothetical protein
MAKRDSAALRIRPEPDPQGQPALGKFVSIELPEDALAALNEVMRITGDSPESLFRKAMGLYKIAVDAGLSGNRVAVVDPEGEFVQDITGF